MLTMLTGYEQILSNSYVSLIYIEALYVVKILPNKLFRNVFLILGFDKENVLFVQDGL